MTVRINFERRGDVWEIIDILYIAYDASSMKIADNVDKTEIVYFHQNRQEKIRNHITALAKALQAEEKRLEAKENKIESDSTTETSGFYMRKNDDSE